MLSYKDGENTQSLAQSPLPEGDDGQKKQNLYFIFSISLKLLKPEPI